MIIVDTVKPVAQPVTPTIAEANNAGGTAYSNTYDLPASPTIADDYDGDVTSTLSVSADSGITATVGSGTVQIENVGVGDYGFGYSYHDFASVFGFNNQNLN